MGQEEVITILVPVLGRAHQIQPLLDNIAAVTKSPYEVVFICSPDDDTRLVCKKTDARTIVVPWKPKRSDFAKKINHAFSLIDSEWFFQGATDIKFHDGWDTAALKTASLNKVGVVGTNDLGNPSVKKGIHATHILFSGDYIDTYGGTYDDTGEVFCELYDHQWVDTEFIQTAILRHQFKPCLKSVVEHLHPHWNKGEYDDTYAKSERSYHLDAKLYHERMRTVRRSHGRRRRPVVRG